MLLYRIAAESYSRDLSGRGAQIYGGRWNPKGMAVLYTTENASQALLEYLPHFPATCVPADLMLITLEAPDNLSILELTKEELPANWNARPPIAATAVIGREWLIARNSVALRVPSVMLPYGKAWNLLLNPLHPDFSVLRIAEILPLPVDPRLAEKMRGRS
jgi:RES domain-containing protein